MLRPGELDPERQLELRLAEASAAMCIASGRRAGRPVRRLRGRRPEPRPALRPHRRLQARTDGFDLHARVRVARGDRKRLERLGRYLLRPAVCGERLHLRDDGRYQYDLRRPWGDGTMAVLFEPDELMEKLAALVPIPRANLVRYHGLLAPAAEWRSLVVPSPEPDPFALHNPVGGLVPPDRVPWAQLLRRVWMVEVLRCARCGGRRRLIAEVTNPAAILAMLEHLGLDPHGPSPAPARSPPTESYPWAS